MNFELTVFNQFYGLDWVAMFFIFLSLYHLGKQHRAGFVFGVLGSVAWIGFNFIAGSLAGVLANFIFIGLNIRGWWQWGKQNHGK
jgi:nicotinamide riboside transporter PnuC